MKFYIVTPSFNAVEMLRLCVASVADQAGPGVEVRHHVQDGGSQDGTVGYLERYAAALKEHPVENYSFSYASGRDSGMYNAINRGWDAADADADLIAWLNCDEQYLPGALRFVAERFFADPRLDVSFGDLLMLDEDGAFICYRKAHQPRWPMIAADYLYTYSCTMFIRKRVFDDGMRLDERFKAVADEDLVVRILRSGRRVRHFKHYLSVFACTGENLSLAPHAVAESKALFNEAPAWVRHSKWWLNKARLMEKLLNGCYHEKKALAYEIYDASDVSARRRRIAEHPGWKCIPFLEVGEEK